MAEERRIAYLSEGNDPDGPFRAVANPPVMVVNPDGRSALTPEGGFALKMTNKTGAATVKGALVSASTIDDSFALTGPGNDNHIGVVYTPNIADGADAWIVVEGRAEALLEDGQAGTPAFGVNPSTSVAGRVKIDPVAPGCVGNCIETIASGTDVLCFIILNGGGGTAPATGIKSGLIIPGSFSGPGVLQASIVFATAFADANYSITMDVESTNDKSWGMSIQNKTAAGFTLSLGSGSLSNLVQVGWQAIPVGE